MKVTLLANHLEHKLRLFNAMKVFLCILLFALSLSFLSSTNGFAKAKQQTIGNPIPIFAYYYIWYEPASWSRAKIDYPMIGRYSSDDLSVMRQHINWAKGAGIDGFIVSWKSTEKLNRRLEQLMKIAEEEEFKLMIIYQGLTFERQPRPLDQVADDFDLFIKIFAPSPAFQFFSKPLLIWNGTSQYTLEDIALITQERRDSIFILATEKNKDAYNHVAEFVDGNAYYWSSANPKTYSGYQEKLNEIGSAIHEHAGIWIPSAAPGFDARLVGGERVIEREDGEMLRLQLDAAFRSAPDVVGLTSWNEFSENTHVEPSETFKMHYLDALIEFLNVPPLPFPEFDTSDTVTTREPQKSPVEDQEHAKKMTFLNLDIGRIGSMLYLIGLFLISSFILVIRRLLE